MNLLARYLKQIEKYLPFKERKDTIDELRSLIMDQVDEQVALGKNQKDALYDVIVESGEPREVAARYSDRGPIISKEMEPVLNLVIKIVSITLPLVVLFANAIEYIFKTEDFTTMDFLLDIAYSIPSAIYSLVVAIGFIFIFFYLIERYVNPQFETQEKKFLPEFLPDIPKKAFKVSLVESVISILFTVLALYIFNYNQGLISVYYDGNKLPILNDNFEKILIFMNIGWLVSISLHIVYVFTKKKTIITKSVELVLGIYSGIILFMLASSDIFNQVVIDGHNLNFLTSMFTVGFILIAFAAVIGSIVEYIKMFVSLKK